MKHKKQENKSSTRDTRYALRDSAGFSFIEVMLSVFLLSAGMVAAISLMGGALRESIDSRNQLIASLLAQEGVELVRNIRDTNWVTAGADSFDHLAALDNCRIDKNYSYPDDLTCSPLNNLALRIDGSNFYTHTGVTATKFSRKIRIDVSGNDRIVTSMVVWKESFPTIANIANITECTTGARCSYAQSTLTRWKE